jgi:hypothetical protein
VGSRSRVSRTRSRVGPCDERAGPTRFARAPRAKSARRTPLLPSRNSSETLAARRQQQPSAPRASARPPDARGRGTRRTRGSRAPAPGPPGGEWSRQWLEDRGSHCGAPATLSSAASHPRVMRGAANWSGTVSSDHQCTSVCRTGTGVPDWDRAHAVCPRLLVC